MSRMRRTPADAGGPVGGPWSLEASARSRRGRRSKGDRFPPRSAPSARLHAVRSRPRSLRNDGRRMDDVPGAAGDDPVVAPAAPGLPDGDVMTSVGDTPAGPDAMGVVVDVPPL